MCRFFFAFQELHSLSFGFEPINVRQAFGGDVGKRIAINIDNEHTVHIDAEDDSLLPAAHIVAGIAVEITPGNNILISVSGDIRHSQSEVF